MKKFKGFTLIELIVVIAIIGVLCAILVPSMMGWVTKSRVNSANSNAKAIFNSAASVITSFETQGFDETGANTGEPIEDGVYSKLKDTELTEGSLAAEVARMEESTGGEAWAFLVDDGYVDAAVYSSNGNGYMGAFPNPVPEDEKMAFSTSDETLATAANVDEDWVTSEG